MVRKIRELMMRYWKPKGRRDVYISKDCAENDKEYLEEALTRAGFDLNGTGTITEVNDHIICYSHNDTPTEPVKAIGAESSPVDDLQYTTDRKGHLTLVNDTC